MTKNTHNDDKQQQTNLARHYEETTTKKRKNSDGVVVTPVEIVDYQIRFTRHETIKKYGVEISDPAVADILDPFTGTGIYLARLLQTARDDEVQALVNKIYGLEIDPTAAAIADENIKTVARERGATPPDRPLVICADTFRIPPEQSIPELFEEVKRTGTHPYDPRKGQPCQTMTA